MPLSLSDDEFAAVQAAAAPIHPLQRDAFLKALAAELEQHAVVGPGLVHRVAAALQRAFGVAGHIETALTLSHDSGAGGRLKLSSGRRRTDTGSGDCGPKTCSRRPSLNREARAKREKQGRPPMSLANMRENAVRAVTATCGSCNRSSDVNVDALPETVYVPDVGRRLRCSQCRGKKIATRPAWHTSRDAWGRPEVRPHEQP